MAKLNPNELSHKQRFISALDYLHLLHLVMKAKETKNIGFEHVSETFQGMLKKLNKRMRIRESDLESALWCAKLLDEKGKFFHFRGITFDQWINMLLEDGVLNERYLWIEEKKK